MEGGDDEDDEDDEDNEESFNLDEIFPVSFSRSSFSFSSFFTRCQTARASSMELTFSAPKIYGHLLCNFSTALLAAPWILTLREERDFAMEVKNRTFISKSPSSSSSFSSIFSRSIRSDSLKVSIESRNGGVAGVLESEEAGSWSPL